MSKSSLHLSLLAVSALTLIFLRPVAASGEAEEAFTRYQQVIEVTKQCRQIGFSDDEYERMGAIINQKINHDVGAKRLSLMLAAQKDARKLVEAEGCGSDRVRDLLEVYDTELK